MAANMALLDLEVNLSVEMGSCDGLMRHGRGLHTATDRREVDIRIWFRSPPPSQYTSTPVLDRDNITFSLPSTTPSTMSDLENELLGLAEDDSNRHHNKRAAGGRKNHQS